MARRIKIPAKVRAGLSRAFTVIRAHCERARWTELAMAHSTHLDGASDSVVETRLRETATRGATREHSLLSYAVDGVFGGHPADVDVVMAGAGAWLHEALDPFRAHPLTVTVTGVDTGSQVAHLAFQPDTEPKGDLVVRHVVKSRISRGEYAGRFEVWCDFGGDTGVTNVFDNIHYCPFCGQVVDTEGVS